MVILQHCIQFVFSYLMCKDTLFTALYIEKVILDLQILQFVPEK